MVFARELWCEAVVYMHCVAQPSEENERTSAPTPIEHFKLDARLDSDELHLVWRWIGRKRPRGLFGGLSEGKRGSAALDPRASDSVAVGAELAFVGEPDHADHKLHSGVLHADGVCPITRGALIDAVDSCFQRPAVIVYDL